VRCSGFQDRGYAEALPRPLEPIVNLDHAADGYKLTKRNRRFLALWMCYEDVIPRRRSEDAQEPLRTRARGVRGEAHEPVHIVEFLKPGMDELTPVLPRFLAARSNAWPGRAVSPTSSTSACTLRRPASAASSCWPACLAASFQASHLALHEEQALIGRWLASIAAAAKGGDADLALEIALCGRADQGLRRDAPAQQGQFPEILDTLSRADALVGRSRPDRGDP